MNEQNERQWIRTLHAMESLSRIMATIGIILIGAACWVLPDLWMRLGAFGILCIFISVCYKMAGKRG